MGTIAIIPARGGSQRIKNKNITEFCGKPLISYSINTAKMAGIFDEIHVSTDDAIIKKVAEDYGASAQFMRPAALADNHAPLVSVLRWVLNEYLSRGMKFESICLLLPTAPLLLPSDLVAGYRDFKNRNCEHPVMAVTRYPVPVEWALERSSNALFTPVFPEKAKIRSQDLKETFFDAGAFVYFSSCHLLDETYPLGNYLFGYQLPKSRAVDIDDEEDLELARILYRGSHIKTN
jgi:pseudaminic acid cytidylyltransferase